MFSDGLQKMALTVPQNSRAGILIGFSEQRLLEVEKELFEKSSFIDVSEAVIPYMLFDKSIG